MGLGIAYMKYMSKKGFFNMLDPKILDIGSQNLLAAMPEDIEEFALRHGFSGDLSHLKEEAKRISYFSTPRSGERTSYVSELLDLTTISYHSYDICPALKTEIFELNFQSIPKHFKNRFDVVLNFGTTEHILNQYNVFKVIHEATRIGGYMIHQVPCIGWLNHGYVCYQSLFFQDIAECNHYRVFDKWLNPAGVSPIDTFNLEIRSGEHPDPDDEQKILSENKLIENFNLNVVFVKEKDINFSVPLELLTSHSAPDTKYDPKKGLIKGES